MRYKGYVKGGVIILANPLSVPDGTEVEIFIPSVNVAKHKGQEKRSVAEATFGMIRSDPTLVRVVLEADLYEA
jgi:hypothetical protein